MGERLYDPAHRRFISPDPLIARPSRVASYDPYSYAFNNPLKFSDPSGRSPEEAVEKARTPTRQTSDDYYQSTVTGHWRGGSARADTTPASPYHSTVTAEQVDGQSRQVTMPDGVAQAPPAQRVNDDGLGPRSISSAGGSRWSAAKRTVRDYAFDFESRYGTVPGWKWGLGAGGLVAAGGGLFAEGVAASVYVGATRAAYWVAGLGGAGVVAHEAVEEGVPRAEQAVTLAQEGTPTINLAGHGWEFLEGELWTVPEGDVHNYGTKGRGNPRRLGAGD